MTRPWALTRLQGLDEEAFTLGLDKQAFRSQMVTSPERSEKTQMGHLLQQLTVCVRPTGGRLCSLLAALFCVFGTGAACVQVGQGSWHPSTARAWLAAVIGTVVRACVFYNSNCAYLGCLCVARVVELGWHQLTGVRCMTRRFTVDG